METICAASMASMESLGAMLFIIEIMKARLASSGFCAITLAFTNCFRMPCNASRRDGAERVSQQSLSGFRVGMIDGDAPPVEFDARARSRVAAIGCRNRRRGVAIWGCRHVLCPLPAQACERRARVVRAATNFEMSMRGLRAIAARRPWGGRPGRRRLLR